MSEATKTSSYLEAAAVAEEVVAAAARTLDACKLEVAVCSSSE